MGADVSHIPVDMTTLGPAVEVEHPDRYFWKVHHTFETDHGDLSVLCHAIKSTENFEHLHMSLKHSQLIKHPGLLKVLDVHYDGDLVGLITEPMQPLAVVLDALEPWDIIAGLHSVLEGLLFLHQTCGMSHNTVGIESIYVTEDGTWKLGGLEACRELHHLDLPHLKLWAAVRQQAITPEEKREQIIRELTWGVDVYSVGKLFELLLVHVEDLGQEVVHSLEATIEECLSSDPRDRPKLTSLLKHRLFQNEFLEILTFLKNVIVKTDAQKEQFFKELLPRLQAMPSDLVASRLARPLLARFVLLCSPATTYIIPSLLTLRGTSDIPHDVQPLLSEEQMKTHLCVHLFKIFHVHDLTVRLVLLRHFPVYARVFEKVMLEKLLPQILLGLRDTDEGLAAATLHALATLVPLLGGDAVIGPDREPLFSTFRPRGPVKTTSGVETSSTVSQVITQSSPDSLKRAKEGLPNEEEKKWTKLEREQRRKKQKEKAEERRKQREAERLEKEKKKPVTLLEMAKKAKNVPSDRSSWDNVSLNSFSSTLSRSSSVREQTKAPTYAYTGATHTKVRSRDEEETEDEDEEEVKQEEEELTQEGVESDLLELAECGEAEDLSDWGEIEEDLKAATASVVPEVVVSDRLASPVTSDRSMASSRESEIKETEGPLNEMTESDRELWTNVLNVKDTKIVVTDIKSSSSFGTDIDAGVGTRGDVGRAKSSLSDGNADRSSKDEGRTRNVDSFSGADSGWGDAGWGSSNWEADASALSSRDQTTPLPRDSTVSRSSSVTSEGGSKKKGALKLTSKNAKDKSDKMPRVDVSDIPGDVLLEEAQESWGGAWGEVEESSSPGGEKKIVKSTMKAAKSKQSDSFTGWDIKTLEFKVSSKTEEVDFFSDMMPNLNPAVGSKMSGKLGLEGAGESSSSSAAAQRNLFEVQEVDGSEDVVGDGGWGDWGDD